MKTIPVYKNGKIVGEMLVDDADYDRIIKHKWFLLESKSKAKYIGRSINNGKFWNSQAVTEFLLGKKDEFLISHQDGDIFNNQRSNLTWMHRMS